MYQKRVVVVVQEGIHLAIAVSKWNRLGPAELSRFHLLAAAQ